MKFFILIIFILTITLTTVASPANAQLGITRKNQTSGMGLPVPAAGNSASTLSTIIRNIVTLFYSIGALGFTIMIIWGSVDWILSGGDKEKVAGGRKRITTAITGLVVLSLSFLFMVIAGQVLSIDALQFGKFQIPGLGAGP